MVVIFSGKRIVLSAVLFSVFFSVFVAMQFTAGSGSARCEEPDGAVKQVDKSSYAYTRVFGRAAVLAQAGGGPDTEDAVISALGWLARHQDPDGHWDSDKFDSQCKETVKCVDAGYAENDFGVTGLALLAFLGRGYTHLSKEKYGDIIFGDVVKNGLKWLIIHQDEEGCFGPKAGKFTYNHCIAAMAMNEAYVMTESQLFKDSAQKGVDFIALAQNRGQGWRYQVQPGDNDTSVTGWAVMALKSAQADLNVPAQTFTGAINWIKNVTSEPYYDVGYTAKGTGKVYIVNMNENWAGHETLTAVGMLCRMFIEKDNTDKALEGGAKLLNKSLPVYDTTPKVEIPIDYYYWYYATQAMYQFDGPAGKYWTGWNDALKKALLAGQKRKDAGCLAGSWDASVDRWGIEGGRVYATALNALTLETYYRYPRVLEKEDGKKEK